MLDIRPTKKSKKAKTYLTIPNQQWLVDTILFWDAVAFRTLAKQGFFKIIIQSLVLPNCQKQSRCVDTPSNSTYTP